MLFLATIAGVVPVGAKGLSRQISICIDEDLERLLAGMYDDRQSICSSDPVVFQSIVPGKQTPTYAGIGARVQ